MLYLKRLFNFYIFGNIHVGITAWCFTEITLLEFGITDYKVAFFIFFSTISSYNFIRLYRIQEIDNWFVHWLNLNKKNIIVVTIFSLIAVSYLVFFIKQRALIGLVPFALFTLFYVIPISSKQNKKISLRKIAGLKIFLIAISWAGITVIFPILQFNIPLDIHVWITFFQRFLLAILLVIPFDIRDLYIDNKSMNTIPQVIGVRNSKIMATFIIILVFLLEYLKKTGIYHLIIIALVLIVLFGLNIKATRNQNRYFSAFWVDAIPILWWLLLVIPI